MDELRDVVVDDQVEADSPARARRSPAAAKFLTQTPGWKSSGWCPVTTRGVGDVRPGSVTVPAVPRPCRENIAAPSRRPHGGPSAANARRLPTLEVVIPGASRPAFRRRAARAWPRGGSTSKPPSVAGGRRGGAVIQHTPRHVTTARGPALEHPPIVGQPVRGVVERAAEGPRLVQVDQRHRDLLDREAVRDRLDPDLQGHGIAVVGDLEPGSRAEVR